MNPYVTLEEQFHLSYRKSPIGTPRPIRTSSKRVGDRISRGLPNVGK